MTKRERFYSNNADDGCSPYTFQGCIPYKYYGRLLDIAEENHVITFDINDAISFVIKNFPAVNDEK